MARPRAPRPRKAAPSRAPTSKRTPADALARVRDGQHTRVRVAITDLDGVLRGKYLHRDKFLSAAEGGFGFCNVVFGWDAADLCYDNVAYTGWHTGYPDALARIDLSTFRTVPWDGGVPLFLADFDGDAGADLPMCPRRLLRRVLAGAAEAGYTAKAGMEFEWFNFRETPQSLAERGYVDPRPLTPGMFGYSLLRVGRNLPLFQALQDELGAFGVPIEGLHTETGPGVFEAAIAYSEALEAADRAVLFKAGVKDIAARFDVLPSFMARWSERLPGCSGHIHQSLWDARGNLFHDARDPQRLSKRCRSYLAGVLHAMPELLPMYAPTVNSYKRLVEGYWAPVRANWGIDNRTVAVRAIPGGARSTRLEIRVPGADANPYLAMAASIASGLWGIAQGLELTQAPVTGSGYADTRAPRLPRNLAEAAERMAGSALAAELLGRPFVEHFTRTREWEWRQYSAAVTSWELRRYFEII